MNHYVYKIIDPITNEFYYGSRSCKCNIEDDNYMGSYKTWLPINSNRLVKIILNSEFDNREEAIIKEAKLIKLEIDNSLNRNYAIPTEGYHTLGKFHSKPTKKLMKEKSKNRYTLSWFVSKYGNIVGLKKYNEKSKKQSILLAGKNNPMFGKYHTNESKNKISKLNSKEVNQYNLNGTLIKKWNSLTEAANVIGISVSTINACCDINRINKTGKGFIWKLT